MKALNQGKLLKSDAAVAALLAAILVVCKSNIINAPYYWDEMCAYVQPAHWLAKGGLYRAFPGFHPIDTFYGHPFAIYLALATLFKVFGESVWLSHLFILTVSFLGVFYTYLLAKYLYDTSTGIISSLLLLFSPLFFAQSGMVNGDTVVTSLGVITTYYFLEKRYGLFLVSSTILVLSKESSAAFVVAMLIYIFLEEKSHRAAVIKAFKYAAPLYILCGFFLLQKATTGDFLPNKYFNNHNFFEPTVSLLLNKLGLVLNWTFILQYRFVLLLFIVLAFALDFKSVFRREYLLFGIVSLFFICTYTGIFFLVRYIMPILPYFFIIGAASIVRVLRYRKMYSLATCALLALFCTKLYGSGDNYGSSETDMQYTDIIATHHAACRYVETWPREVTVLTNQPLSTDLTLPYVGYIKSPVKVVSSPTANFDLLLYSRQTDEATAKALESTISDKNLVLAKSFRQNGKAVDVYVKDRNAFHTTIDLLSLYRNYDIDKETSILPSATGIVIDCKSNDPRIIIPFKMEEKRQYRVKVVIRSPLNTYCQLYYKSSLESSYSERSSMKKALENGDNTVYFNITADNITGNLRFDPGAKRGRYQIKSFQLLTM